MEIIIEKYEYNPNYYALSIKNYGFYIQLGWIERYIFNDSVKKYTNFLNKIKHSTNLFKKQEIILFETIYDAQYAMDILNSIVILNTLTQN